MDGPQNNNMYQCLSYLWACSGVSDARIVEDLKGEELSRDLDLDDPSVEDILKAEGAGCAERMEPQPRLSHSSKKM